MKSILCTFVAIFSMVTLEANAQLKFGVKGGLNATQLNVKGDIISKSGNIGFFFGPTLYLNIPLIGLGVDGSVLYDQRSGDVKTYVGSEQITDETITLTRRQIAIPVNLRYGFGLGDKASMFFFAGPQFGFDISGKVKDIDWEWKSSNISANVGVGIMALSHLQATLNYNVECGKTGEATASSVLSDAFNSKHHAWQISLAYYF